MNVRRAKTGNRVHISDMGVLFPLLPVGFIVIKDALKPLVNTPETVTH